MCLFGRWRIVSVIGFVSMTQSCLVHRTWSFGPGELPSSLFLVTAIFTTLAGHRTKRTACVTVIVCSIDVSWRSWESLSPFVGINARSFGSVKLGTLRHWKNDYV
jgi:hypothetical protein